MEPHTNTNQFLYFTNLKNYKKMKTSYSESATRDLMKEIKVLIHDLGLDYHRMSKNGQEIYDELCEKLGID